MAIVVNVNSYAGTPEDDEIVGTYDGSSDTLRGADGADFIDGLGGDDSLVGDAGNDTIYGRDGNDTLDGGEGNDYLIGYEDNDSVLGGSGDDTLFGHAGSNTINGEIGDDLILFGIGQDTVDGGDGTDKLGFAFYDLGVGVEITLAATGSGSGSINGVNSVTFSNIEEVYLTSYADVVNGGGGNARVVTEGGHDLFNGGTGDEYFDGGLDNDTINGGGGNDTLLGGYGEGNDILSGGVGDDNMDGGTGDDTLDGGEDNDALWGVGGNDILSGGVGDDNMDGGTGDDTLDGGEDNDALWGVGGDDSLTGGSGNDTIRGGAGNDLMTGGSGADTFDITTTAADADTIADWGDGADVLEGSAFAGQQLIVTIANTSTIQFHAATAFATSGVVSVTGGTGNDTITGGAGADSLWGGAGADILGGGAGADALQGGDDDDALIGGEGNDNLDGGEDNDSVWGEAGNDVLSGRDGNDTLVGGAGNDSLTGEEGEDSLFGDDGNDYLSGGLGNDSMYAGSGDDTIYGDEGDDVLAGDDGNDTIWGGDGNDSMTGGSGNDYIYGGAGNKFVSGGSGDDFFAVGPGLNTIDGGTGFDTLAAVLYFGAGTYSTGLIVNMADGIVKVNLTQSYAAPLISVESISGTGLNDLYDARGFGANSVNAGSLGYLNEFKGYGNDTVFGNGHTRLTYSGAEAGVYVNLVTGESLDLLDKNNGTTVDEAEIGTLSIQGGVNRLSGGGNGDMLIGGVAANDLLEVFVGKGGNDTLSGGSGFDRARYDVNTVYSWTDFTQGVTVNLASGAVVGDVNYLGNDTLLGIESVVGTILADAYDATGFSGTSANAGSYGTFNEFQGRGGDDRVIGNGNTRVSYVDSNAGVSVNLVSGISSSLEAGDIALVGVDTISGVNAVKGSAFGDELIGSIAGDMLEGRAGDDSITGGVGNDRINGGLGSDTAVYAGDLSSVISIGRSADGLSTIIKTVNEGTDTLTNIEYLKFGSTDAISLASAIATLRAAPVFASMRIDLNASLSDGVEMIEGGTFGGESSEAQLVDTSNVFVMPDFYTGSVAGIDFQLIDTSANAVVVGSAFNDFIVLQGTGNKAVDGGEGSDIIDGGTGSSFVTGGGAGIADTFFFDGRSAGTTWSTIADFELGLDKTTIWGWKEGVSRVFALDAEGGAAGYTGLTLHFENLLPDGASATDTNPNLNSITLTGLELSDFGVSSLAELNAQIANQTNSHFVVDTVSDVHGDHGYLLIS